MNTLCRNLLLNAHLAQTSAGMNYPLAGRHIAGLLLSSAGCRHTDMSLEWFSNQANMDSHARCIKVVSRIYRINSNEWVRLREAGNHKWDALTVAWWHTRKDIINAKA